jgi:16S rRNA (guanine966-N2)-methyltransferase
LRIIGGSHRRRLIEFSDARDLRPTPDRVRETVFNWLGQTLDGRRCLDLFAGSGALGFEAASRGAVEVVMVENNRTVFRALQENQQKLGLRNVVLHCGSGLDFLRRPHRVGYDVVFLDPPFRSGYLVDALLLLPVWLTENGVVYVESGESFEADPSWQVLKRAKAGRVFYQLLRHIQDD